MAASTESRRPIIISLLLVLTVWLTYWGVVRHDFVNYDDQDYVTQNSIVRKGITAEGIRWAFTQAHSANWHPVTWLSHMLDCQFFGLHAGAHHLVNVALHSANAVILFLWLRRSTNAIGLSALVAALFALHPLRVESVAWIAERKDLLCGFFFLLALLNYAHYVQAKSGRARHYWLALLCAALALMSKSMAVTLPFVLLLLDFWPFNRLTGPNSPGVAALLREKLPFFAMSAAVCAVTLLTQDPAMEFARTLSWEQRLGNAVVAYIRYLGKLFWPLNLAVIYPHPGQWPVWRVAGSVGLLAVLTVVAWHWRRRQPQLLMGWFWFLGMLVPVIGVVQVGVQSMADRYTYLPMVGLLVGLIWAAASWINKASEPNRWAITVVAAVVFLCIIRSQIQLATWRNTETLFQHALTATHGNWVAHFNLADLAMQRHQQSRLELTAALPGTVNSAPNHLVKVIEHCQEGLRFNPEFPGPRIMLAKALMERGELRSAAEQVAIVLRLDPRNPDPHQIQGDISLQLRDVSGAIAAYRRALERKPDWDAVLNNLAWILATHPQEQFRDGSTAVEYAQRASAMHSATNFWFLQTLAAAHAENGDFASAANVAAQAVTLARKLAEPRINEIAETRQTLYINRQPYRDANLPLTTGNSSQQSP